MAKLVLTPDTVLKSAMIVCLALFSLQPVYPQSSGYSVPAPARGRWGQPSNWQQSNLQSNAIRSGTSDSLIQANVQQEAGPVNIMFLLDASYSMKDKLGGSEKKINAAKEVLETALARIPNDVNVGIRVFGQGFSGVPEIDCRQTALLVPLGTHNRNSIIQRVRTIEPFGLTPLEFALRLTAEEDFRSAQGPKTIILISDGADTCGGNPCAFIRLLPAYGIRIKCDIVGLALHNDPKSRAQLNCVAEASGGKYYDANTASELIDSVSRSVDKAISGRVVPRGGAPESGAAPGTESPQTPQIPQTHSNNSAQQNIEAPGDSTVIPMPVPVPPPKANP